MIPQINYMYTRKNYFFTDIFVVTEKNKVLAIWDCRCVNQRYSKSASRKTRSYTAVLVTSTIFNEWGKNTKCRCSKVSTVTVFN